MGRVYTDWTLAGSAWDKAVSFEPHFIHLENGMRVCTLKRYFENQR